MLKMPRPSSGGRPSRRAQARSPTPKPAVRHAPPPPPPPAHVQPNHGGSISRGIGSNIAEGMAIGTGFAMANRAADVMLGPRTIQHQTVASDRVSNSIPSGSCDIHYKAFQDCLNGYGTDISKCQIYMDMLSECRMNSGRVP